MHALVTNQNGEYSVKLLSDESKVGEILSSLKDVTDYKIVYASHTLDIAQRYLRLQGACSAFRTMLYNLDREKFPFTDEQKKTINEFVDASKLLTDLF